MSRASMGEPIRVKPQNNAFTVLAAAATVIVLLGFIALFLRSKELLGGNGFFGS